MVNEPAKPYVSPKTGKPLGPISEYTEDWAVGIEKIKASLHDLQITQVWSVRATASVPISIMMLPIVFSSLALSSCGRDYACTMTYVWHLS